MVLSAKGKVDVSPQAKSYLSYHLTWFEVSLIELGVIAGGSNVVPVRSWAGYVLLEWLGRDFEPHVKR